MCFLNSAAPPPWSNLYIYAHTELDEHHNHIVWESLSALQIYLLQRSCKPPTASSVTPPFIKKYILGQDPIVLCASAFFKLNCWVASGRQSPGGVVVKALLLALHDKDNSFFCQKRNRILNAAVLEVLLPWMLLLWLMLLWSMNVVKISVA